MKSKAEEAISKSKNSVDGYRYKGEALVMQGQEKTDDLTVALQWVN